MIELTEGSSVLTEKGKAPKGIDFQPKLKRIDFLSNRVYQKDKEDTYYPSVTSILNYLPCSAFFLEWLSDVGHNAEIIRNKAAREGTQVHEAIERMLAGEELNWINDRGSAIYNLQVWQMILRAFEFFSTYKPETIATELFLWSDKHRYAGATDWLGKIDGQTWLLDFKTSNHLSKSYDLQLAAYAKALEECKGIEIDKAGVLWLKAATRKPSKIQGVYQGEGWQIKEVADLDKDFEAFKNVYKIYELYNPDLAKPIYKSYPTVLKLN